ncbi:acetyltransferase, GNAT family [Formosa sp. Hel1_33_131]|jgi:ribosomal protein S18 acetylase RimI-like enzyme|uniref:GNAT family N-acetyltransferase n=1 Tax=Formosa sp. Hel1_33_131 TaxID=1336794 RepID=UPI00084E2A6A|nr:GNAT family N-acetyltransferase [Formosa sp. Hel1_33_131]AOR27637.1 acetyltransferase, GNAT family [Formosa sp. Hel1_33_131]
MIRNYTKKDKSTLIELLRQNTPEYFDPSEEIEFINYLDHEVEDYFVYELDFKIIGAGGINYFLEEKSARISWDMVDSKSQGKGIGKKLTQHRINHLKRNTEVEIIRVRTSQHAYKFYEKMGFELEKIEKEYWAKNFDLYLMQMRNETNI